MTARSAEESWARRRTKYARWLEDPDSFVLVAEANHQLLGYAFVTVGSGYSSWDSGRQQAQLETLSVAPSMRGHGLGSRLLGAVRDQLGDAGIETLALSAACPNDAAHRFYERQASAGRRSCSWERHETACKSGRPTCSTDGTTMVVVGTFVVWGCAPSTQSLAAGREHCAYNGITTSRGQDCFAKYWSTRIL